MTPAELLALADAATPGPWDFTDANAVWDETQDVIFGVSRADARLMSLAPDLAWLCAEMGEALEELSVEGWFASWSDDPRVLTIRAALAKLSELEPR